MKAKVTVTVRIAEPFEYTEMVDTAPVVPSDNITVKRGYIPACAYQGTFEYVEPINPEAARRARETAAEAARYEMVSKAEAAIVEQGHPRYTVSLALMRARVEWDWHNDRSEWMRQNLSRARCNIM